MPRGNETVQLQHTERFEQEKLVDVHYLPVEQKSSYVFAMQSRSLL